MTNRCISNDPYMTNVGLMNTTGMLFRSEDLIGSDSSKISPLIDCAAMPPSACFRDSGTSMARRCFVSAANKEKAVGVYAPWRISVSSGERPTVWRTSAGWGTKSAEGFTAIWEMSAGWGTCSEISSWPEDLSVQIQYEAGEPGNWLTSRFGSSETVH